VPIFGLLGGAHLLQIGKSCSGIPQVSARFPRIGFGIEIVADESMPAAEVCIFGDKIEIFGETLKEIVSSAFGAGGRFIGPIDHWGAHGAPPEIIPTSPLVS
jgi:hypothetical protein